MNLINRRRVNLIGTKNCGEKRNGESEGGQKFLPPNPLPFCPPEPKRSPAACSVRSRSQQKSFLFLLEEKIQRAQKKSRENFFAGWRALASGGGANQPFCSKKVRTKCKISPPLDFFIGRPEYLNKIFIWKIRKN
jgi:hypothetical protein